MSVGLVYGISPSGRNDICFPCHIEGSAAADSTEISHVQLVFLGSIWDFSPQTEQALRLPAESVAELSYLVSNVKRGLKTV